VVDALTAVVAFCALAVALVVGGLWIRARASRDALQARVVALERERAKFAGFFSHLPYPALFQDERGEIVLMNEAARANDAWRERNPDTRPQNGRRNRRTLSVRFPLAVDGKPWLAGLEIERSDPDAEERKPRDLALEAETLFERAPVPLWIVRSPGGVVEGNAAAYELFGSAVLRETVRVKGWSFMRGARALDPDETPIAIALRERRSVAGAELELLREDGARQLVRVSAAPLLDTAGNLRGAVAVAIDASEVGRYQAELERAVRRRDEFLAVLAHELRNPLAPVRNSVEILQRVPGDVERVKRATMTIDRQTLLLVRLIDDLLDVARVSQGLVELDLAPHALGHVVDGAVDAMRAVAEGSGHSIVVEHAAAEAVVNVDRLRVQQILTNLLSNAIKYSVPRSSVTVRTFVDGADACVAVIDRGQGIPAELQADIFTMFSAGVQARGRARGMGVGLALAKQLSEQQGGALRVSSEGRGRGSTFTVSFPLMKRAASAAA
jgi:PAS domain S-box-containing protein